MASVSRWAAAMLFLLAAAPAAAQDRTTTRPLPAALTSPVLETFASEAEFRSYLRALHREAVKRDPWAALARPVQVAQNQDTPCTDPDPKNCPTAASDSGQSIVVTGSRVASKPSITNVQVAGVDEGDIVKQIGRFLLVLQDGRVFSIDTGGNALALVDRVNVYRDANEGGWYDEMLVQDDHVIVTGYSYGNDAADVSVFRLGPTGKLTSEGTFLISSDDYYSVDNYATRIVGDQLVVYSPMDISEIDLDKPIRWPRIRRWQPEEAYDEDITRGTVMFDATSIYKPIQPTAFPVIHTLSMCPIGPVRKGREMRCRTTALVGPAGRTFYVDPTDIYLWTGPGWEEYNPDSNEDCGTWQRRGEADASPASIFRIPMAGGEPTAVRMLGSPTDQFSLDVSGGHFHALLRWLPIHCKALEKGSHSQFRFFDVPISAFDAEPQEVQRSAYTPLPAIGTENIENRFTDHYVVYGGRPGSRWNSRPPEDGDAMPLVSRAVAVPIAAPAQATTLDVPHGVIRIERVGDDIVITGYRDQAGLRVTSVDLSATPRIGATLLLANRFESEGRSHAFNSLPAPDGSALMGLPTVHPEGDSDRWWWYSSPSDVSFLAMDAQRRLAAVGELSPAKDAVDPSYKCEVSCIDWYGNSRPIFTDGRIFALSGTELIEGRVDAGKMIELRRLNLSRPLKP
jgi:hypothetical protein